MKRPYIGKKFNWNLVGSLYELTTVCLSFGYKDVVETYSRVKDLVGVGLSLRSGVHRLWVSKSSESTYDHSVAERPGCTSIHQTHGFLNETSLAIYMYTIPNCALHSIIIIMIHELKTRRCSTQISSFVSRYSQAIHIFLHHSLMSSIHSLLGLPRLPIPFMISNITLFACIVATYINV